MAFYLTLLTMKKKILHWIPALIMMIVIFGFSSQTITSLPNFDWADQIVKKSGHIIGYALLASSYWFGLEQRKERLWLAWVLAILFALTDEYHQSFVFGRHSTIWDMLIFDNLGALIGLWLTNRFGNKNDQMQTPDRHNR
jgi:VanZ family protein